jgi:hypothetical protein
VAISLGKTATVSIGGITAGARDVTVDESAEELEFGLYGIRDRFVYTAGYTLEVQVELIDDAASALFAVLQSGAEIAVTVSPGGGAFVAVVTNVSQSSSLDGLTTWRVTAKKTYPGLRA